MKSSVPAALLTCLFFIQMGHAVTPGAKTLIYHETKSNAVARRELEPRAMPHYEIPLRLLDIDFADRFPERIRQHLIFEHNGEKYARWIINPEDTLWFKEVAQHFRAQGIDLIKKYYFTGYQTASRSYIVEDPNKTIQFSVKSSTNKADGDWLKKKQPVGEAIDSRMNADILSFVQKKLQFEHAIILDEPAILKIPAIDQAVVIRDLHALNDSSSGRYYLPGFAALHETTGKKIALQNGSNNPLDFWTEHYIKATARAMAELAARTGIQFDSPHSQNFLIELDINMKPTGRIVLRDLADFYIYEKFMHALHPDAQTYLRNYSQRDRLIDYIHASFAPLHGNSNPTWVNDAQYTQWKEIYYSEFEKTFSKISNLPLATFKTTGSYQVAKYFKQRYTIDGNSDAVQKFWKNVSETKTPRGIVSCSRALISRH
ncbi:Ferric iron reductase FhuF-like transporter [compost metagenome]